MRPPNNHLSSINASLKIKLLQIRKNKYTEKNIDISTAIESQKFLARKNPFKNQQNTRKCIALNQSMVWLLKRCEAAHLIDNLLH